MIVQWTRGVGSSVGVVLVLPSTPLSHFFFVMVLMAKFQPSQYACPAAAYVLLATMISTSLISASAIVSPSSSRSSMDECLSSCGQQYTRGRLLTICGTDSVTHSLNFSAYYSW
jgi:hypothetical protein